jgi:hypothetical protein
MELDAIVRKCLQKTPSDRYPTISKLADALNGYLANRQAGGTQDPVPGAARSSPDSAPLLLVNEAKIRIPGVHARWPGGLLALVLMAGAGSYYADRTGRVRVRDFTDGWLTAAPLAPDAPMPMPRGNYEPPPLNVVLGVVAVAPVVETNGMPTVRAEREPELVPGKPARAAASEPMSASERERRQERYRDFLKSEGLTPLRDALPNDSVRAPPH